MTNHPLAQQWTTAKLLRFAAPTTFMMLFMVLYTIVDTVFVTRFVGTDALSAINIVCPVTNFIVGIGTNFIVGIGTMLATGGNAILSRKMGAGKHQEAKEDFTLLILSSALISVLLFALGTCISSAQAHASCPTHKTISFSFCSLPRRICYKPSLPAFLLPRESQILAPVYRLLSASPTSFSIIYSS